MQNYPLPSNIFLAIILIAPSCFAQVRPASAQLAELATEAVNTLNNSQQQPRSSQSSTNHSSLQHSLWGNSDFNVGTDNLSGNTINLCISGCIPHNEPALKPLPSTPKTHLPIHFERL